MDADIHLSYRIDWT